MKTMINSLKATMFIACIIILFSFTVRAAAKWEQARYGASGFSIGSKGYIGTGFGYVNNAFSLKKDFWEYDPATDSWSQKADFGGTARRFAVGFSIGTKGYIGTGNPDGTFAKDFWEYNPTSNTWARKADFGGTARGAATGFSIGTKGYIGTGQGLAGTSLYNTSDFWEYDPATDTWSQKADFTGIARYAAAGFSINNKGYIGTGINWVSSTQYTFQKDFYEYDPTTNTWTRKADFGGIIRAFSAGFCIGSKGYIGTGSTSGTLLNDFWEYNPSTDTWLQKAGFGGKIRSSTASFSIGTKGYIGTGCIATNSYAQDFWEYNQSNNAWTQKTDLGITHKGNLKEGETTDEMYANVSNTELVVYPNPSATIFNFRLKTMSEDLVNIKIFDLTGRLVHEYLSLSPYQIMTVGETIAAGAYIAVVTQGEYRKTVKINKVN
ncbi:MAG: T9SS type A sorting domain-containing protein [Bacteroidota bacterium]|jgi:N-acetylneuraminic acid mutarotase